MPAGFTAFPTLTPSPTSGLGPAAPSTYSAFPQQHFEAQGHAITSMNGVHCWVPAIVACQKKSPGCWRLHLSDARDMAKAENVTKYTP